MDKITMDMYSSQKLVLVTYCLLPPQNSAGDEMENENAGRQ